MGTVWVTPSPESNTIPVVRPEAYSDRTAWIATYIAGELNVSNMIYNKQHFITTHLQPIRYNVPIKQI